MRWWSRWWRLQNHASNGLKNLSYLFPEAFFKAGKNRNVKNKKIENIIIKKEYHKLSNQRIIYGSSTIEFKLKYTDRKTLGITVHPDSSVEVKAPLNASKERIFERLERRAGWILEQQRYFSSFEPNRVSYVYKSGETHYYLGRQYRLKIVEGAGEEVLYRRNFLHVVTMDSSPQNVKQLLHAWYRTRAQVKFAEYAAPLVERFKRYDVAPNSIVVQQMEYRWGSCTAKGNILLNPLLVKAPIACIEYVIIHELCHLVHRNHTKAYYALLSREMPDWEKWKERLEQFAF